MAHSDPNKIQFEHNLDDILNSAKKLKTELDNLTRSEDMLKRKMGETTRTAQGQSRGMDDISDQAKKARQEAVHTYEEGKRKVKDWLNTFRESRKEMTRSMAGLNPIDTSEFSSGFQLSAKSLFGFGSAIKSAFSEMKSLQGMRHEMAYLADASGNASRAVGAVFNIAAGSAISRATAQGVVRTLADQGLALTDAAGKASPKIERLGKLAGDLQAATGIAASQWGSFTGELSFNYGLSEKGIQNIASALVGTGLRAQHLERAMSTVNKVMQTTAYIAGVPTDASMNKLTKSIGGAMKAFQKMGISAEKAGSFIEGIVDPENFEKNSHLFAQLGISASEYAESLNDANGQQKLLEKVMGNLPSLAQKLSSIQNPFARMEMAKSLGLDMQTVRRMATSSKEEIEKIMKEYESKNKADEALAKKKERMTADAAKWDDMIWGLKMQVLQPVMKMLSGGYLQKFIGMLPKIAGVISEIFKTVSPIIEGVVDMMVGMVPAFQAFIKTITEFFSGFASGVKETIGVATDSVVGGKNKPSESAQFWGTALKYLAGAYAFLKVISIGLGLGKGVYTGFKTIQTGLSILFGSGSRKKVMNATLADLQTTIKNGVNDSNKGPMQMGMGGPLMALLGPLMMGGLGMKLMGWVSDKIMGETDYKDLLNQEKVFVDDVSEMKIALKGGLQKVGLLAGVNGDKLLKLTTQGGRAQFTETFKEGSKVTEEVIQARKAAKLAERYSGALYETRLAEQMGKNSTKIAKNLGGFTKVIGKASVGLGIALDAYSLTTAETKAERWAAAASLVSTGIGAAIGGIGGAITGGSIGALAGGVGALPGAVAGGAAGFVKGGTIGQIIGIPASMIASYFGAKADREDTQNIINNSEAFHMFKKGGIFEDFGKQMVEQASFKTQLENQTGTNVWKETDFEKRRKDFEEMTAENLKNEMTGAQKGLMGSVKNVDQNKVSGNLQQALQDQAVLNWKNSRKEFDILQYREALLKQDDKLIEKEKKYILDRGTLTKTEMKTMEESIQALAKRRDWNQNTIGKITSTMMEAFKTNDFSRMESIIKIAFRKISRALINGIKEMPGVTTFLKGKGIDLDEFEKKLNGDESNTDLRKQIGEIQSQLSQTAEGRNALNALQKSNVDMKNNEQIEGYLLELNLALMKATQAQNKNTKAIKDQTNATNANTDAQNTKNAESGSKYDSAPIEYNVSGYVLIS